MLVPARFGVRSWFEKLNAEDAETFSEIKRAFVAGEVAERMSVVARGVKTMLTRRGIKVGEEQIIKWLKQN